MIAPVNKIIDSSVVDGPGNRTAIFFQGCNFNCMYCHNPETINMCMGCGECVKKCPTGALSFKDDKVIYDISKCVNCDTCIKTCTHNASPKICYMNVDELYEHVADNMPFIEGITVSGGECTLRAPFIRELFKKAKDDGLSTLIDSNGTYDFRNDEELLKVTDGVMLDIKAGEDNEHLMLTGMTSDKVYENAVYLASIGKLFEIRTVCSMNILDSKNTILTASRLLEGHLEEVNYKLIKYRHYGVREDRQVFIEPDDDFMNELRDYAYSLGFRKIVII